MVGLMNQDVRRTHVLSHEGFVKDLLVRHGAVREEAVLPRDRAVGTTGAEVFARGPKDVEAEAEADHEIKCRRQACFGVLGQHVLVVEEVRRLRV